MKRTLLLIPCVLVAASWAAKWKLDHPAPTQADQKFARLMSGADEIEITSCLGHKQARLTENDLQNLLQNVHLSNDAGMLSQGCDSSYRLDFQRKGRPLAAFDVDFDAGTLSNDGSFHPAIERRSRRNLERALLDFLSHASFVS